jgi:DNA repair protein RadD
MITLRPRQERAFNMLRQALASGSKRPMLQAPTGFGKTELMAAITLSAAEKRRRVIVGVPAIELVDQTVERFFRYGIREVGVLQADHPMTNSARPIQVACMPTLARRVIPDASLVLIDEAHQKSQFLEKWMTMNDWLDVPFVGFSATPWSKGLGRLYDRLLIAATTQQLIDEKLLSPFRVFAPSHPDLSQVRTVRGDFDEGQLSAVMSEKALTADIVRTWLAKARGRPTLCFAVDRTHAKTIQAQFEAAGVRCGYVDGETPKEEREEVRKRFASGDYEVVANVNVLTTGVDWDVRCIILARPTKSPVLYTQLIGRGLRTAPGKDFCLILDHSDTTLRLGFVTDIHREKLDDGTLGDLSDPQRSESEPPKPKECPKCHHVRPAKVPTCPSCGYVPEKISGVQTREGELIDATMARRMLIAEQVEFMAQLRKYQELKGKPDTWVLAKFKSRYKAWPTDRAVKEAQPAQAISPEVKRWLQSSNIRYAKGAARRGVAA